VQFFVHGWDAQQHTWATRASAFTQGLVTPRRMAMGSLFLLAAKDQDASPKWDPENATLPAGRYLIKVYVDTHQRLATDPTAYLDDSDPYGQIELEDAQWREGFKQAEWISAANFQRDSALQ